MNNVTNLWNKATENASTVTTEQLDLYARTYKELEDTLDKFSELKKELQKKVDEAEKRMVTAMEMAGKTKYFVEGLGTFSFTERMSVRVPKLMDAKKALADWLTKKGGDDLFWGLFSVNSQTLNSFYKTEYENYVATPGDKAPFFIPGLEAPTATRSLRFNKEKS